MITADTVHYRLAERGDADAFCALSNSLYARKVTPAYFLWQFFDNPNDPALMLACHGDEVIGAFGLHTVGDGADRRTMCLDIMLAKPAQGHGLIDGLTRAAIASAQARGAKSIAVVGNDKAYRALTRHLGWTLHASLRTWEIASEAVAADKGCTPVAGVPDLPPAQPGFYPRSAACLTWRTVDNPRYGYTWLHFPGDGGAAEAWAVVKLFQDPLSGRRYGDILEIVSTDYSAPAFLRHVSAFAGALKPDTDVISLLPRNADQSAALSGMGYAPGGPARHVMTAEGPVPPVGMLDIDVY